MDDNCKYLKQNKCIVIDGRAIQGQCREIIIFTILSRTRNEDFNFFIFLFKSKISRDKGIFHDFFVV